MSPDQIDAIKAEIVAGISGAAALASAVDPAISPLVSIGATVAKLIGPAAFADIVLLVQKTPPTDAEVASLAVEISKLSHPETL